MRLTRAQRLILQRMCRRDFDVDCAESGGEMALALWSTGAFSSTEHGQRVASQLVKKGLAEQLGYTSTNARCYGPTDEGRAVFKQLEGKA